MVQPAVVRVQPACRPAVSSSRAPLVSVNGKRGSSQQKQQQQSIGPRVASVSRAKQWTPDVENAFRLSEAGYKGVPELLAMGQPEPERWPESGFIRKLRTRYSLGSEQQSLLYFRQTPECIPKYLNRVKIYTFEGV